MAWCAGTSHRLQSLELEAGYSRQGNLYAGDTQNTNTDSDTRSKYGDETNRLYRQNYSADLERRLG